MRRYIFFLVTILLAFGVNVQIAWGDLFDNQLGPYASVIRKALAQKNLTFEDVTFDLHDRGFFGGDRYRLPFFDALTDNPWKIPGYVPVIRQAAFSAARSGDVAGLCQQAQARLNSAVRVGLVGDPTEIYASMLADETVDNHLLVALKRLYAQRGLTLTPSEEAYLTEKAAGVPQPVVDAAALYLYALPDILAYHDAAMAPVKSKLQASSLGPEDPVTWYLSRTLDDEPRLGEEAERIPKSTHYDQLTEFLLDNLDWGYLHTSAMVLAHVVGRMRKGLEEYTASEEDFGFAFDTPLGMLVLNGPESDDYSGALPYVLIIDAGGNDHYLGGGANVSSANPCSLLIDLAGDDIYECNAEGIPSFGCGVFGFGMLIDRAGDDSYAAQRYSQGSGLFGVGLLMDESGEDRYSVVTEGQASGTFGTGILADLAGEDVYECYGSSQGYGFTLGCGLLVDLTGNDSYLANDTDIKFPSSQSKEHNSSLAQGFGFGRRGDYTTGHSWAGGVGLLLDAEGNDTYSCGVFGQGSGYWYGTGILTDGSGDDEYIGHWYVQASGAHFAVGILDDAAGNDHYSADMNMAQGAGHDFSLGFLVERLGSDIYDAPNLSLGGGNANGIGVFWDLGGDDIYNVSAATTLGRANNGQRGELRDFMRGLGLFIDTGGNDSYPPDYEFAGNNRMWTQEGTNSEEPLPLVELGVGVDAEVAVP